MKLAKFISSTLFLVTAVACTGAADSSPGDDVPVDGAVSHSEAIGEGCANSIATAIFNQVVSYVSPERYTTAYCYKSIVLDVADYGSSRSFGGGGATGQPSTGTGGVNPGELESMWNGPLETPEACSSAIIKIMLFRREQGSWVFATQKHASGTWYGVCALPRLLFTAADLERGQSYRFAITARTADSTSAPTRSFTVISRRSGD